MSAFAPPRVFSPSYDRAPSAIREREVLRVAGTLGGILSDVEPDTVRRQILSWVQNRAGGKLPNEARAGESFEHYSGGRNSIGIRIINPEYDFWTVRADDPDKNTPGRVWTSEVVIGQRPNDKLHFCARLLVSSAEQIIDFIPHSPGFVFQIASQCGLYQGDYRIEGMPRFVDTDDDCQLFMDMLTDPDRRFPVYAISIPESVATDWSHPVDTHRLARAVVGLGMIAVLSPSAVWGMTNRFGKQLSVFGGAVRAYSPGFDAGCRPYDHTLFLADRLNFHEGATRCESWIRVHAANNSRRQALLGRDVLSFHSIRSLSLQSIETKLVQEGAPDNERMLAHQRSIEALNKEISDARNMQDYFSEEYSKSEERALAAEDQLRASALRIQYLLDIVNGNGRSLVHRSSEALPQEWTNFVEWCEAELAGTVILIPSARKMVRNPEFRKVERVARCLQWLSSTGRDARIDGIGRSTRDQLIEAGVYNSPCGADSFDFDWQGKRLLADWHVKNGGNTRDPSRCLRIYYGWDDDTRQIVVAHMPSHRRTGAS